jgi:hypothetical protein
MIHQRHLIPKLEFKFNVVPGAWVLSVCLLLLMMRQQQHQQHHQNLSNPIAALVVDHDHHFYSSYYVATFLLFQQYLRLAPPLKPTVLYHNCRGQDRRGAGGRPTTVTIILGVSHPDSIAYYVVFVFIIMVVMVVVIGGRGGGGIVVVVVPRQIPRTSVTPFRKHSSGGY